MVIFIYRLTFLLIDKNQINIKSVTVIIFLYVFIYLLLLIEITIILNSVEIKQYYYSI